MADTRITQERVLTPATQDVDARTTQERVEIGVTQDVLARFTQERVVVGTKQTVLARFTQERLIVAVIPGGRMNIAGRPGASAFYARQSGGRANIAA